MVESNKNHLKSSMNIISQLFPSGSGSSCFQCMSSHASTSCTTYVARVTMLKLDCEMIHEYMDTSRQLLGRNSRL
jgi:hypothetical protein